MPHVRTRVHAIASAPVRAIRVEVVKGPDSGKSLLAESNTITVGTSPDSNLVLTDETVSRYHLELRHLGDRVEVEDLGSTNGTLHGKAYIKRAAVLPGALLQLGETTLIVESGDVLPVEVYNDDNLHGVRGRSVAMRGLMARIQRVAQSDVSALLLGETGVGKEVVASAIHRASARAGGPFETVDCGALAPTLIASELFGHERGAFTGADRRYIGAFERADKGTLFLDEIGELPPGLQTALLGAIERRAFRRVGGDRPIAVDVRLVCATNRDLRSEVNAEKFREDLYYRIAVVRLDIPPLRDRIEDAPLLLEHFLRQAGFDGAVSSLIPSQVIDRVLEYRWPGNVRELRNFAEAALAMGEPPNLEIPRAVDSRSAPLPRSSSVATGDLGAVDGGGAGAAGTGGSSAVFPSVPLAELLLLKFKDARGLLLEEFEKRYLQELLRRTDSNVSQAARVAEIHRTYLIEMLKRHGLR